MSKSAWGSKSQTTAATSGASTGSKWGTKTAASATTTGSKWGSKGTATGSSSNFSAGAQKPRSIQSGTAWIDNKGRIDQKILDAKLTSSVDIPFAPCHFEEKGMNGQVDKFELHNILYFGMFRHLNMITLRYNDYVTKGGIQLHPFDDKNQDKAATTTGTAATAASKFSLNTSKTTTVRTFGATSQNMIEVNPFLFESKDFGEMKDLQDVTLKSKEYYDAPTEQPAVRPFGELGESQIKLMKKSDYTVSYYKPLKKFTPRGFNEKDKTLFQEAQRKPINKNQDDIFSKISFKKTSQNYQKGTSSTGRTGGTSRTAMSSNMGNPNNDSGFEPVLWNRILTRTNEQQFINATLTFRQQTYFHIIFPHITEEIINHLNISKPTRIETNKKDDPKSRKDDAQSNKDDRNDDYRFDITIQDIEESHIEHLINLPLIIRIEYPKELFNANFSDKKALNVILIDEDDTIANENVKSNQQKLELEASATSPLTNVLFMAGKLPCPIKSVESPFYINYHFEFLNNAVTIKISTHKNAI